MKTFIIPALILCFAVVCSAQTFRGGIQGTVTDPNGAVVPGAEVTITSPDTGLTRTIVTGDSGAYSVSEIPIGSYRVIVKKSGFQSPPVSARVEVATTTRADIQLALAAATVDWVVVPTRNQL